MLNRCDFRCVLKVENVRHRRRSTGRLSNHVDGDGKSTVADERCVECSLQTVCRHRLS